MSASQLNLSWVSALLVDPDAHSAKLLSRMLEGFGLKKYKVVESVEAALQSLESEPPDIVFCESRLASNSCADLILTVRKMADKALRVIPIVVFTGYTERTMVETARDSGANLVMKKPIEATAMYDRLAWVAKGTRGFVEAATYVGPDRRFKNAGLPNGVGRRATDLGGEVGTQVETNMSQDEIDNLIKPMKIDL
jgi:two-component system, chemotaxis family, chemotaxis protein CheY